MTRYKTCEPSTARDPIDIAALQKKYLEERDKRLRPEGSKQYVEVADDLADYYEIDPYSPPVVRDPLTDEIDVAILGGGFAGLIIGARLKEAGVTNIRIIEMAGDFGGTWYWNRYPGVQCDVESYTYMPLLEEVGYIPKHRYAFGGEIFEHCQRLGRHFGLYENALFGTTVRDMRWSEDLARWRISTNHGDDIRARFVVMASGPLNKPKLPGIPGLKTFKGHSFHTARWDYDYTGGDPTGGMTKLADKRVAIIGTGATGIQAIPFLGRDAKHLYVFQRTPSSVGVRGNQPTDMAWAQSLQPGWQSARHRSFQKGIFEGYSSLDEDLICDGWAEISRNVTARVAEFGETPTVEQIMALHEEEDYRLMERLRGRIDSIVEDKDTADKLKPWYRYMCKRPCFNDEYLPTFNRPNVTLVDVSGERGVERITEKGLIANGIEYEVDCIIYASGFEVTSDLKRRFGIGAIEGRDGLSLYDHWAGGFVTLHGLMTHGFPNQFFTGFSQNAITAAHNLLYEQQGRQIIHIVKETMARGATTVEPSAEGQEAWVQTIRDTAIDAEAFRAECTPGYYNNEGVKVRSSPIFGEPYGPGLLSFERLLTEWREKRELEGMILSQ